MHIPIMRKSKKKGKTLSICRELSIIARILGTERREVAVFPGISNIFSFKFDTASGSNPMNACLKNNKNFLVKSGNGMLLTPII